MRLQKAILSILFVFIITSLPTAAHAISVTIGGVTFGDPAVGMSIDIPAGIYDGVFQLDEFIGLPAAQAVAVPGVPNVLSLTAAQITNIGTSRATLTVVYQHNFVANTSVERFHGASMDGGFYDLSNLGRVVSGSTIVKTSFVGYLRQGSSSLVFTTYNVPLSYTVPSPPENFSPVDNGFGLRNSGSLICSNVVGGPCDSVEVLLTIVEITLDPGVSLGLVG